MTNQLIKFLCILLLATNVVAGGDDRDSGPVESLDEVVVFDPCTDDSDADTVYTSLILSSDSGFVGGQIISAESGTQAIVASYDDETHTLIYFQTAETGYGSFAEDDVITGALSGAGTVEEVVVEAAMPCGEQMVSIDEEALEMTLEPKTVLEEAADNVVEFFEETFVLESQQPKGPKNGQGGLYLKGLMPNKLSNDQIIILD
ncbi:MAG: hypothetical protein AAEF72_06175, partial [Gammaproteobacteria bacterium]